MLRIPIAAAVLLVTHAWLQDMPVTRLAGGGPGRAAPQNPATPAPQPPRPAGTPLPPLPVTQIDRRDSATTLDSPRRLTLTFSEPQPIDGVLQLLVYGTPFSLAMDPDVTGTFRGELKQLTLREALTTLLSPLALEFQVQGTVIRIRRQQTETRQYDLNMLNVQRGLRTESATPSGAASLSTTVMADDVFGRIADGVRMLLSTTGRLHVDGRAGLAQVTDFPERLDRVGLYIEALHQRSGRQVRLQAQVFEVTLKDAPSIDWQAVRATLGLPRDAADAGLAADPVALRTALAAQGEIRPLWAPEMTTLNNEPALLRVAADGYSSLTLIVVPQISADGIVQLSVSHAWEEHAGDRKQGFMKASTPLTRLTESDTVTRVMDGNTVMISGLLRPRTIAAAASGVGGFFGAQTKQPAHAELVVLLRPTVVTPGTFSHGSRQ